MNETDPEFDKSIGALRAEIVRFVGPSDPLEALSSQHRMLPERHLFERLESQSKPASVEDAPSAFTSSSLPSKTSSTENETSPALESFDVRKPLPVGTTEEMEATITVLTDTLVEREAALHQMMYLATSQTANYQDIVQLRSRINALEGLTDQINFRVTQVSADPSMDWMQRFLPGALEAVFARREGLERERKEKSEQWVKLKIKGFTTNVLSSVEKLLMEDERSRNATKDANKTAWENMAFRVGSLEEKVRHLEELVERREEEVVTRREFEAAMLELEKRLHKSRYTVISSPEGK